MRTNLFLIGIWLVSHGMIQAQTPNVIRVKGGPGAVKNLPFTERYQYEQFREGKILYQTGTSATARFNYNVLLSEMQFIDQRGDTLAIANEPLVRMVGIGDPSSRQDVFWCDQSRGYLQIIQDYDVVKLGMKQGLKTVKSEKRGGYEQSSGTSAITNYQFYAGGNTSVRALDAKGDLLLIKDKVYFLVDYNGRSFPANRANVLKVYNKQRKQVAAYLEQEMVNFNQEEDLKKLLDYCSKLL